MEMPSREFSSLFVDGHDEVDDDDAISLTSTAESQHDSDEEFVVDAVLAEQPSRDPAQGGGMMYLIKWENYPLYRCTWETAGQLSEELRDQWLEQKREEQERRRRPFDLREYEYAMAEAIRSKAQRHERRNLKRQKQNLPMTEPFPSGYTAPALHLQSLADFQSRDEEVEVEEIDLGRAATIAKRRMEKQATSGVVLTSTLATDQPNTIAKGPSKPQDTSPTPRESTATGTGPSTGSQCPPRRPSDMSSKTTNLPTSQHAATSSSSSLANKFFAKRHKATRTGNPIPLITRKSTASAPIPIPKPRKVRASLKEAMMDPAKEPKLMSNMRMVNQLHKKARELNDSAPANPSAIPAGYFITNDPPSRKTSSDPSNKHNSDSTANTTSSRKNSSGTLHKHHSDPAADTTSSRKNSSDTSNTHYGDSPADSMSPTEASRQSAIAPPTGPRRSRSGKTVRFTQDDVDSSSADLSNVGPTETGASTSAPAPRRLSLQSYQERSALHSVAKAAVFGPEGSQEIHVVFHDIPRSNNEWVSHFLAEGSLQFRAVCTAEDFFLHRGQLYNPQFKLASGKLESETDPASLDTLATNLRISSSGLYLVSEFYSILVFPGRCPEWEGAENPFQPSTDPLRYLIFKLVVADQLLLPKHYPISTDAGNMESQPVNQVALRIKLMEEIAAAVNYDSLLHDSVGDKHVFFLLFHASEMTAFGALALWLRAQRPDCQIFHNLEPGGWKRYHEETKAGTVIISRSTEKNIRHIPNMWSSLKHGAHTFWSLSISDHEASITPLTSRVPPQLTMTLLFPHGRAFLITPSFAIAQPDRLRRFLEWFQHRSTYAPCVLVVCANFAGFLLEVAKEKAMERDHYISEFGEWDEHGASKKGLSREDHEQRILAWEFVTYKLKTSSEASEDVSKVVCASDLIAPDDEQSLVNWFAAWSTSRIDRYRKFYVLGTGLADSRRAHRKVRVPNYAPGTVNDPDRILGAAKGDEVSQGERKKPSSAPYVFRSQILPGDGASDFKEWLYSRDPVNFWLFRGPVGWLDINMAERFGHFKGEYGTFTQWLHDIPSFEKKCNALMGLFYTPETDSEEPPSAARRPWLGILRPVNPHIKPYTRMELLIWDSSANFRKQASVSREDLIPMQRRLIDFVQAEIPNLFPKYPLLERVFVGDLDLGVPREFKYPVDLTCYALETFLSDRKTWVPPWDTLLLAKGWVLLQDTAPPENNAGRGTTQLELSRAPFDADEPQRIIFHAPRGDSDQGSKCKNHLYEAASRARRSQPDRRHFYYEFHPTLQWYQVQEDENRGFQHIKVESWEAIFSDLDIKQQRR